MTPPSGFPPAPRPIAPGSGSTSRGSPRKPAASSVGSGSLSARPSPERWTDSATAFRRSGSTGGCLSGMPDGSALQHLSGLGGGATRARARDPARYAVSKGTIRFPLDTPLPATLIRRLAKVRLSELPAGRTR